jgi:hypothetical protein
MELNFFPLLLIVGRRVDGPLDSEEIDTMNSATHSIKDRDQLAVYFTQNVDNPYYTTMGEKNIHKITSSLN